MVISGSFYHAHHTRHGRTDLSSIFGVETRPEADARRMHQNEAKRGEKDHGAHNSARCTGRHRLEQSVSMSSKQQFATYVMKADYTIL